jgi:hypothetical protein
MKHTKGTWHTSHNSSSISIYSDTMDCDIATIGLTHRDYKEEEAGANAALIAASPDLLEAAIRILQEFDEHAVQLHTPIAYFKPFEALREAINKATNK